MRWWGSPEVLRWVAVEVKIRGVLAAARGVARLGTGKILGMLLAAAKKETETARPQTLRNKCPSSPSCALRPAALSPPLVHFVAQQVRCEFMCGRFTTDPAGDLPRFEPTSNPALDTHLARIRDELFIPSHLLERHKQLVYRKKNHKLLQEEPVEIEITGQTVPLTPKLHQTTIPLKAFTEAIKLMKTRSDFDAIPGLISGFAQVKRQFRPRQFELMARTLATQNRTDLLLKIAQSAAQQEHGFKFTVDTGRDFMRGFWVRAQHPKRKEALKAVSQASVVHAIMGTEAARFDKTSVSNDLVVLATLLDIKAQACIRFNGGVDYVPKGKKDAEQGGRNVVEQVAVKVMDQLELEEIPEMVIDKEHVPKIKRAYLNWWFVAQALKHGLEVLKEGDSRVSKLMPKKLIEVEMKVDKWKAFLEANEASGGKTPDLFLQAVEDMKKDIETEPVEEEVEEGEEVEEKN